MPWIRSIFGIGPMLRMYPAWFHASSFIYFFHFIVSFPQYNKVCLFFHIWQFEISWLTFYYNQDITQYDTLWNNIIIFS